MCLASRKLLLAARELALVGTTCGRIQRVALILASACHMSQEAWPSRYRASIALAACVRGVCCVLYRYAVCGMRYAPCALHVLWPELTICFVVAWYGRGRCWELVLVLAAAFPSCSSILRPSGRRAGQSACLVARPQRPRATLISQAPSLHLPTEIIYVASLRACSSHACLLRMGLSVRGAADICFVCRTAPLLGSATRTTAARQERASLACNCAQQTTSS